MSASDSTKPAADKSRAPRRIRRRPVVPKFHVDDDDFATEAEAILWSDSLYRAETRVEKTRPDLKDARAKSLAVAIAGSLFEYAKELGAESPDTDDDMSDDSDRPAHDPMPVAHTNGSGHSAGSAQA